MKFMMAQGHLLVILSALQLGARGAPNTRLGLAAMISEHTSSVRSPQIVPSWLRSALAICCLSLGVRRLPGIAA